jgi:hypothetical protein
VTDRPMMRLGDLKPSQGVDLATAKIDTGFDVFDFVVTVGRGSKGEWQGIARCSHNGVVHFRVRSPVAPSFEELEPHIIYLMEQLENKYGCEFEFSGVEMEPFSSRFAGKR